jgi:hypothetical protein
MSLVGGPQKQGILSKKKAARWLNLAAFELAFGGAGGI